MTTTIHIWDRETESREFRSSDGIWQHDNNLTYCGQWVVPTAAPSVVPPEAATCTGCILVRLAREAT